MAKQRPKFEYHKSWDNIVDTKVAWEALTWRSLLHSGQSLTERKGKGYQVCDDPKPTTFALTGESIVCPSNIYFTIGIP